MAIAVASQVWLVAQSVSRPTVPYESPGVCPFECCTYRAWTVEADTDLLADRRDAAVVVVRVRKGEKVEGLTGVVITTRLGRAVTRKPVASGGVRIEGAASVDVIHYIGEEHWKIWFDGRLLEWAIPDARDCAGERGRESRCDLRVVERPQTTWWARVRASGGQEGWTRQLDRFGNIDACGRPDPRVLRACIPSPRALADRL